MRDLGDRMYSEHMCVTKLLQLTHAYLNDVREARRDTVSTASKAQSVPLSGQIMLDIPVLNKQDEYRRVMVNLK